MSALRKHSQGRSGSSARFWRWAARTRLSSSADADFDAAVTGVVASAFGFSGQKCSACSRVIVEEPIYDAFVERLREKVPELKVGDPTGNANMGPVVSEGR